jgi:hypothetical protein
MINTYCFSTATMIIGSQVKCSLYVLVNFVVSLNNFRFRRVCLSSGKYLIYWSCLSVHLPVVMYRMFNLKVDSQLSRKYFTSDAIFNGSAGMTVYYYMCRSWQDCCRRGENRSWPSVSVESVDNECWCLNNAIFYAFIMRLTVEECVFILEILSKNDVLRPL